MALFRRHRRWLTAAAVMAGLWATGQVPFLNVLRIRHHPSGRIAYCTRVGAGEEFVLSYTHSVNRRPVYDTLRAAGDHLVVVSSRFDSFGAGMPDGSDGRLTVAADGWLIYHVERPVPEVVVRVGRVAGHRLRIKNQDLALASLASPGSPLRFEAARASIADLIKGRCIQWQ